MKKVYIRYLVPGLLEIDMPEEIESLPKEKQRDWAHEVLDSKSNRQLLKGLETIDYPGTDISNRIFDETPWVEAIEDKETLEIILKTKLWETYTNGDKLCED